MPASTQSLLLPRLMYLIAGLAWLPLLWPMPYTVLLAACLACLAIPLYRRLRHFSRGSRNRLEKEKARLIAALKAAPRTHSFFPLLTRHREARLPLLTRMRLWLGLSWFKTLPLLGTFATIFFSIAVPVILFVVMVAPQVASGFSRLRELWMHDFELPEEISVPLNKFVQSIESLPGLDMIVGQIDSYQEIISNYLNNFSTDTLVKWANQGFDLLGGASSVALHFLVFLALSIIFIIYAPRIKLISARLLHVNPAILHRFTLAIRMALRAILLGVVFVAVIQGFLCAIGFAIVDVNSFAFWGLLAAILAPIPLLGTALVWVPLCLHLWISGRPAAAAVLLAWCVIIVSSADSVLRPVFLKTGIKASFLVLILAILCGIVAFGSIGIILGPVLLALSIQAMEEGDFSYPSILKPLSVKAPEHKIPYAE